MGRGVRKVTAVDMIGETYLLAFGPFVEDKPGKVRNYREE
jgi:hypothetical protein